MKKETKAYMFSLEYGYIDVVIKEIENDKMIIKMPEDFGNQITTYSIYDEMNNVYEINAIDNDYRLYSFPDCANISDDINDLRYYLDRLVNPQNYE